MKIKKNIINLSISLCLALSFVQSGADASKLPNDVWKYVKQNLPKAQQRFDSVVVINDDIMYIPLYPPVDKTVDKLQVEYVYPSNLSFNQYPEVVLLNNGYSFLKVFKDNSGNYTLTKKDDLPIKVRLGLMPQDMLTPIGLKMPESLKLTLGDLLIPSREETSLAFKDSDKKKTTLNPYNPAVKRNEFTPIAEFKNKKTLINPKNSKFLAVYDNSTQNPLYELKLSSMPLKIVTSEESKVALVLYWSTKELEIIGLKDENTIAKIPIDGTATDATLNKKDNIAYVTSQSAQAIYCIDLNSMQLVRVVKLDQKPSKITYCELDGTIAFYDEYQGKVFNLVKVENDYVVQAMGKTGSVSKVLSDVANVYAISRTQNELYVFDKSHGKLINTITLDAKPTDAILYGTKIFILCSKEGYLDIYDTVNSKLISREQIARDGFYSKMTLIPGDNNILITGISAKNYLLYNLDSMKLVRKQEAYIDVANIIILDKVPRL